jgi:hypothetical protein
VESLQLMQEALRVLRNDLDSINHRLSDYQKLLNERESIRLAIEGLERVIQSSADSPKPPADLPLWKGAQQILEQSKVPLAARDITLRLVGLGFKIAGKTPIESVRTMLIRKPEIFSRTGDGKFELKKPSVATEEKAEEKEGWG